MDKTKIEWCDSTWNPVTGCYHDCPYCYAKNIVARFSKYTGISDKVKVLDYPVLGDDGHKLAYPTGFIPTFHRYRLDDYKNKKGRTIFVCSMADLFGAWVPDNWITEVFHNCEQALQHRYLFLTKNPGRYRILDSYWALVPHKNMWYGSTVTNPGKDYFASDIFNTFLSIEPILESFAGFHVNPLLKWVIIGAETGNRKGKVVPQKERVDELVAQCDSLRIPVFMKDSLIPVVGEENMRQELPWKGEL